MAGYFSRFCVILILLALPRAAAASRRCDPTTIPASRSWNQPLARNITIKATALPLKAALERVSEIANIRLSYSAELLPLQRQVCVAYRQTALGDVITHLLKDVGVEPVVAGADHVVLTPSGAHAHADIQEPQPIVPLEPIFATATADALQPHKPAFGYTEISHEQLTRYANVAQALSAGVPGVWAWPSPAGLTSHYSVRGASSFGASSPKLYIDGIEVANPLLAVQILPENIERIEVIRGPQGGALYGADAINGVTNIVTRHDVAGEGEPRVRVRSGLAFSRSDYVGGSGVGQDHTVALRVGSLLRSGALNFGLGSVGEYMPESYTRHFNLDGSLRLVSDRTVITGTARFVNQTAGNPFGLITDSAFQSSAIGLQQYTVGARAVIQHNDRVTHSIVLGANGYAVGNLPSRFDARLSTADSVLRAAGDGALRTTARLSTVARLNVGANATSAITVAAEHSNLYQYGRFSEGGSYTSRWMDAPEKQPGDGQQYAPPTADVTRTNQAEPGSAFEQSRRSNGLVAQLDASLFERAFLTAGVRLEHDVINDVSVGTSTLPMLSGAYVVGGGPVGARLRGAYGKAIRWPEVRQRVTQWANYPQPNTVISPEQQSGLEAGVDFTLGKVLELQITRFDQTATGLMQGVIIASPGDADGETPTNFYRYALQSVGEISNTGWELQGAVRRGRLALTGTLSLVESRVLRVADGYAGDLRAGDRMLGVPARTASLDASWLGSGWSTSLTAYRAFDWINYDRLALSALQPGQVTGLQLRDYWKHYNGSTHLRATFSRAITRRFTLLLSGDNLLDKQTGEPDNLTVVPGRTVSVGVRAAF